MIRKKILVYLVFFLSFVLSNVEVPQLIEVTVLVGCDHSEPISDIVLLQVLLCQVL